MLSTDKMGKDIKAYWCSKDLHIRDWSTDEIIGSSYDYHGVPRAIVMPSGTALAALTKQQQREKQRKLEEHQKDKKTAKEDKQELTHEEILLAYYWLGHIGLPKLRKALNNQKINSFVCPTCRENKARQQVSREPQNLKSLNEGDPSGLWYADVQMVSPKGVGGETMYVVAVNAATRMTVCFPIKEKKHAADNMIAFTEHIKVQTGEYPREIVLDGGKEFNHFRTWAKSKGITINPTPPRTPEPNGPSERFGGYVNETARCILNEAGLPWELWPYAVELVAHMINRLHRPNDKDKRPPIQKWRE
jgi:transposase InsO family protein